MFEVAARTVHRGGGLRVAISPQLPLEKILKLHMVEVINDSDFALKHRCYLCRWVFVLQAGVPERRNFSLSMTIASKL
jgi:hypothetical protein